MLSFILNCVPTAQARARHMRTKSGLAIAYKSESQKANEATLEALLAPHAPKAPFTCAIYLEFAAFMPIPKSASKKCRAQMLAGEIAPTVKPDLDNLAKQLKDAMTRLRFWQDDRQVVMLMCLKLYGEQPAWEVHVRKAALARSEK